MISYEEVRVKKESEQTMFNAEKARAEKEHLAKQDAAGLAGQETTEKVITVQKVKNITVEMFGFLVNGHFIKAEQMLLNIMEGALEATRAGQSDASKVAIAASDALRVYRSWPT
jgi:hypothetical protein